MAKRRRTLVMFGLLIAGLIPSSSALGSETVYYTYDALGRLVKTTRAGTVNNNVQSQYSYDAAGNRTNVTVSGAITGSGGTPGTGTGSGGDPGSGASTGQAVYIVVPLNGYTLIRVTR